MTTEIDISAVADAVAEATSAAPPAPLPRPLPPGWIMKESRSNPGFYYYFYIPTGLTSWHPPVQDDDGNNIQQAAVDSSNALEDVKEALEPSAAAVAAGGIPSRASPPDGESKEKDPEDAEDRSSKRRKASSSSGPKEVRVLHILKKHKDSRRPSSWRQPKITATLQEAKEELEGLLEILIEEEGNLDELRATFEELARTESDCSSAKRGGDLGFFGRRKMQPAFEEASFALQIGELTKEVVETSSGVHLILRIG